MNEAEKIIARLKTAANARSDEQLATYLGISRQNIGAARKRNDVPPGWIYKVAQLSGYSMDWLCFGRGPQYRLEYEPANSQPADRIADRQAPYGPQAGPGNGAAGILPQADDAPGFGAVVEMLAKIYASQDPLLIGTLSANIRAFYELLNRSRQSARELEELRNPSENS